jgi:ATP-binding cassette subfamily B protein
MLKLNKREILVLLICPILSAALSVFFAYASKNIIDMVFINRDMPYLFFMIPLLIGAYILYFLIEILDVFLVVRWKIKIDFDTKCAYFDRINKIQYEYIEGISSAKLFHRMFSDGSSISGYLFTLCITIPLDIAFSAIFLIIMILWSPQLTIYVMLLIVVQGINLIIFRKPIENINRLQRETDQKVANYVLEKLNLLSFAGIVDIGKWWTRNVEKEFAEARRISIKNSFRLTVFKQLISLVQQFWSLGLLFIGALLIVGNHMSIGVFF